MKVCGSLRHAANLVLTPEVLAHYDASVKSKIIHCDISSGNILILPCFVKHEIADGSALRVTWRGVLADWELSKPIPQGEEIDRARHPERVVCSYRVYNRYQSLTNIIGYMEVHVRRFSSGFPACRRDCG